MPLECSKYFVVNIFSYSMYCAGYLLLPVATHGHEPSIRQKDWLAGLIDRSFLFLTYSCWFQMIWKMDSWLTGLIGRSRPFLIRVDSKYFPNFTKSCGQSTSYIRVGGMLAQFLACKSRESIQQAPKSEFKFFIVDLNAFIFLKI